MNTIKVLDKAVTHISGFDEILYGGLPLGRTTLIEGGPGTGKSIVALEFLYRGALQENPVSLWLLRSGLNRSAVTP